MTSGQGPWVCLCSGPGFSHMQLTPAHSISEHSLLCMGALMPATRPPAQGLREARAQGVGRAEVAAALHLGACLRV